MINDWIIEKGMQSIPSDELVELDSYNNQIQVLRD